MRVVAEVDVELGLTRVVWIGTAQDVGKAINPQAVDGQIEGGTAQGLGLALMEEIQTRDGLITNASFTDYLIPTALDMPPVVSELIEDPEPDAPYGVKGVGEPPTVVSTAAIVSALRDATGRELTRVPVRPDDIVGLLPKGDPQIEGSPRISSAPAPPRRRAAGSRPPASSRAGSAIDAEPAEAVDRGGDDQLAGDHEPDRGGDADLRRGERDREDDERAEDAAEPHPDGWWTDAPTPCEARRATSSTRIPVAPATSVEKPTASTVPTRSPSRPRTAACIEPAKPAEIDITTASAVPPDTGQPY